MKDTSSPIQNIFRVYNYCHMLYNYNLCYRIFDVNMTISKKQIRTKVWRSSIDDWILFFFFFFTIIDFRKKKFFYITVQSLCYYLYKISKGKKNEEREIGVLSNLLHLPTITYIGKDMCTYIAYIFIYIHTRVSLREFVLRRM